MLEPKPNQPFEPSDKVFDPIVKIPVELYHFKEANKIRTPTKHAFLLGGLYIDAGQTVTFEAKFDQVHVDLYIEKLKLIIEVDGVRQPEESKQDGKRDYFLLLNSNNSVQRISNQQISDFIPKDQQIRLSLLGVHAFIQQLRTWKEQGVVPDYHQENKNEYNSNGFADDIIQSLDEIDWLGDGETNWLN